MAKLDEIPGVRRFVSKCTIHPSVIYVCQCGSSKQYQSFNIIFQAVVKVHVCMWCHIKDVTSRFNAQGLMHKPFPPAFALELKFTHRSM